MGQLNSRGLSLPCSRVKVSRVVDIPVSSLLSWKKNKQCDFFQPLEIQTACQDVIKMRRWKTLGGRKGGISLWNSFLDKTEHTKRKEKETPSLAIIYQDVFKMSLLVWGTNSPYECAKGVSSDMCHSSTFFLAKTRLSFSFQRWNSDKGKKKRKTCF